MKNISNSISVATSRVIVIVNTKGGVGKTTVANVFGQLFYSNQNQKINIFEIDDNNTTQENTNYINYQS